MTTTDTFHRGLIQFRSNLLERRIAEYADMWRLTPNETAKRLTALAATHLDADDYDLLASLSQAITGRSSRLDCVRACEQVKIAVDAANRARQEMGMGSLGGEERAKFIQRTIDEMTSKKGQRKAKSRNSE